MPVLFSLLALIGTLTLLNLVLTIGVIRRLREHSGLLSSRGDDTMAAVGKTIAAFTATTTDGEPVSRDLLADQTLVGFFSPTCGPCKETLPDFVRHAREAAGGRRQILAIVSGEEDAAAEMVVQLTPVSRVIVEPHGGPVATAFEVRGYPALALLDGTGTVTATGPMVMEMAARSVMQRA
ncbi:TlpA family protein disulfide reductase [Nonomuraea jiangxiensis]|uniref:Thiol-disulfide isomerase or thioredoxin n=1 Tax=Nonomuraea jiangxiensis TaxID=633440 RepID=A0A1G7Z1B6_9ACTN|nr:TlpA disulfide reductase family protein [Nonomuraea jiangxiensis]SDH02424.1 Thiol-disulfide isomerase or thioredoxin [Nonomuraea jiangxiensis]